MTRWLALTPRLAAAISSRPIRIALGALIIGALGATGLFRFSVDAGQSLLVGSSSSAGQTYTNFAKSFGSDPIVLVFTASNAAAPYAERNLEKLGALEIDLAHDPRVASVLGPGTVAGSLRQAAVSEVTKVLTEYPYFFAETDLAAQLANGNTNQQQLSQRFQSDLSSALTVLELDVIKAAGHAHITRGSYQQQSTDRKVDSQERAVDAAVSQDPLPPLWAQYLAGPTQTANDAAARQFFDRVTAAFGDCDDQIATFLKFTSDCQVFFERTLLNLPACPPVNSNLFCDPKPQWAAVLPRPQPGSPSYEIVTIRLKPQYVGDQTAVASLSDKVNSMLKHGISDDAYTKSLNAQSVGTLKAFGPLVPTECGGVSQQQAPSCFTAYADRPLEYTLAGAPLLGVGVVRTMTQLMALLFPVAIFVMLLILVAVFRVHGRIWPLLAALGATVLTVGLALLTGIPVTPAVLAGVPVLIGLGVDYAVQLVARFNEDRARGESVEGAVRAALTSSGGTTLVAAAATLAGLIALALFAGIDWGPLVAVPLVAEFAVVLCGGVVLAWLGAVFVALPLAVWSDQRRGPAGVPAAAIGGASARSEPADDATAATGGTAAGRTLAIADNWPGVVAPLGLLAVAGWVLLHAVPVQTGVQQLVSPSLQELRDINTVQAETGYTNEIDIYLRGQVATGTIDTQTRIPLSVEWQCSAAADIRANHGDQVAQATSIGDFFIASGSTSTGSSSPGCVARAPSPSPSPSPSASPTPSPASSASASPSALHTSPAMPIPAARRIRGELAASASPGASASPNASPTSPSASASGSPATSPSSSASPRPSPSGGASVTQTPFLCELRLFPLLSRSLVMDINPDNSPCPPVDEYQQKFLSADSGPINPSSGRIALGVISTSVADEAKLVDALNGSHGELANPPGGITATPTGLAVLATTAYDNLVNRAYLLNLAPLVVVAIALFAIYREPRRALLPVLPTVLAAGWAPLILLLLGRLPGGLGETLGSLNPLTVVLGALVVALGTEFGVVLLGRFYEERRRGLEPDAAAAAALAGVGRAIRVSALTLGAGFAVLALSGLFPNSLPLVADFGLAVVIDLALAVAAVFLVMLPVAVAIERHSPLAFPAPAAALVPVPAAAKAKPATSAAPDALPPASRAPRRLPGVSGKRRHAPRDEPAEPAPGSHLRPGVSGRRRRGGGPKGRNG